MKREKFCKTCYGYGSIAKVDINISEISSVFVPSITNCPDCNGTGRVN